MSAAYIVAPSGAGKTTFVEALTGKKQIRGQPYDYTPLVHDGDHLPSVVHAYSQAEQRYGKRWWEKQSVEVKTVIHATIEAAMRAEAERLDDAVIFTAERWPIFDQTLAVAVVCPAYYVMRLNHAARAAKGNDSQPSYVDSDKIVRLIAYYARTAAEHGRVVHPTFRLGMEHLGRYAEKHPRLARLVLETMFRKLA